MVSPYFEIAESVFGFTQFHGFVSILSDQHKIASFSEEAPLRTLGREDLLGYCNPLARGAQSRSA